MRLLLLLTSWIASSSFAQEVVRFPLKEQLTSYPSRVAFCSPEGLLAIGDGEGLLALVNPKNGAIVNKRRVLEHEIETLRCHGGRLYLSRLLEKAVVVVDVATLSVQGRIPLPLYANDMNVDAERGVLIVSGMTHLGDSHRYGRIAFYDLKTQSEIKRGLFTSMLSGHFMDGILPLHVGGKDLLIAYDDIVPIIPLPMDPEVNVLAIYGAKAGSAPWYGKKPQKTRFESIDLIQHAVIGGEDLFLGTGSMRSGDGVDIVKVDPFTGETLAQVSIYAPGEYDAHVPFDAVDQIFYDAAKDRVIAYTQNGKRLVVFRGKDLQRLASYDVEKIFGFGLFALDRRGAYANGALYYAGNEHLARIVLP